MRQNGDTFRVRISGENYTLLARLVDATNGVVEIIDTETVVDGVAVHKVWLGTTLTKPQWHRVESRRKR